MGFSNRLLSQAGELLRCNWESFSISYLIAVVSASMLLFWVAHIVRQLFFFDPNEPPEVFSWIPLVGSTIEYGIDPYKFFFKYQAKYGKCFSFVLVGKKHTVCLGTEGNDFVLGGKLSEISAAEIYRDLTVPTFGKDVVYDAPPAKLMEQKRFLKYSLTSEKLQAYVPIITQEIHKFLASAPSLQGQSGTFEVVSTVGVMSIFTATRTLQGAEVRASFDAELADLYHDLDMSFIPINFFFPNLPLPVNRRRDHAQRKIADTYIRIIQERRRLIQQGLTDPRKSPTQDADDDDDLIWALMRSTYNDGTPIPDHEIAHIMIASLMAGQHTSSSIGAWILLRLGMRPDIQEELYAEQLRILGPTRIPTKADVNKLTLHRMVIRETLRLHIPIHSILRLAKSPLTLTTTGPAPFHPSKAYSIPANRILVSAPGVTAQSSEFFPDPAVWDPHRWEHMPDFLSGAAAPRDAPGYGPLSKAASSAYLPFGAGRHRCVGEHFAYLQLGTIVALLVREFRFWNPDGVERLARTDYESMFTRPVEPAVLCWERRERVE